MPTTILRDGNLLTAWMVLSAAIHPPFDDWLRGAHFRLPYSFTKNRPDVLSFLIPLDHFRGSFTR